MISARRKRSPVLIAILLVGALGAMSGMIVGPAVAAASAAPSSGPDITLHVGGTAPPAGAHPAAGAQPAATAGIQCYGNGTDGDRVQLAYAHTAGNDRLASWL